MDRLRDKVVWFFYGVRVFLPLLPVFMWMVLHELYQSTITYWRDSQSIVEGITSRYISQLPLEMTSDYDPAPYWVCYILASFLYLVGWITMSWITVRAFQLLVSWVFQIG